MGADMKPDQRILDIIPFPNCFFGLAQLNCFKTDEGVPESLWKPHKSKDLTFLHRSYVQLFFSAPKKFRKSNIFFGRKKKSEIF